MVVELRSVIWAMRSLRVPEVVIASDYLEIVEAQNSPHQRPLFRALLEQKIPREQRNMGSEGSRAADMPAIATEYSRVMKWQATGCLQIYLKKKRKRRMRRVDSRSV
ncbi:hypothetical protein Bca52824_050404 [Brassica carinata]|uniref:Uncharacterized protein n=1 Tax=Brassica carinata TaxID=52824 RepID=A0A8X7RQ74_BRACI|nr:hypothetical protein Bca52824_050404 [Brassica carinata]